MFITQGSYIIILRMNVKNGVTAFRWPREDGHLGARLKLYVMAVPQGSDENIFTGSYSWSAIDVKRILDASIDSSDADYDLIFKRKNVAVLKQMSRFDTSKFIKVSSCRLEIQP
jgi:hypothetical protein